MLCSVMSAGSDNAIAIGNDLYSITMLLLIVGSVTRVLMVNDITIF